MNGVIWKSLVVYSGTLIIFGWLSNFIIVPAMRHVNKLTRGLPKGDWEPKGGQWSGVFERFLYIITIAAGFEILAAAWLIYKAAGTWQETKEDARRFPFDHYLFGTAISLFIAIIGVLVSRLVLIWWGLQIALLP